jgi:hypothetical protein
MLSFGREVFRASAIESLLLVFLPLILLLFELLVLLFVFLLLLLVLLFWLLLLLLLLILPLVCCVDFSVALLPDNFCVLVFLVVLSSVFSGIFCACVFFDVSILAFVWFMAGFLLS